MKNLKKLTILHSNDMHGDFLAEQIDERLVGGVSLIGAADQRGAEGIRVQRRETLTLFCLRVNVFQFHIPRISVSGVVIVHQRLVPVVPRQTKRLLS